MLCIYHSDIVTIGSDNCILTLMLLVANLVIIKLCKKRRKKMTGILVHGHSSESAQRELSNAYQYDRV